MVIPMLTGFDGDICGCREVREASIGILCVESLKPVSVKRFSFALVDLLNSVMFGGGVIVLNSQ
jgi:hypothetical protein